MKAEAKKAKKAEEAKKAISRFLKKSKYAGGVTNFVTADFKQVKKAIGII